MRLRDLLNELTSMQKLDENPKVFVNGSELNSVWYDPETQSIALDTARVEFVGEISEETVVPPLKLVLDPDMK